MKKYQIIAEQLMENIKSEKYKIKLPIEDELVEEFQTSKNTIRNATDLLVEWGMLYRVQGSGVYIRQFEHEKAINASMIRGVSQEFKASTVRTEVVYLELVDADEAMASELDTEIGNPVYRLKRIRYVDDEPFTIEYSLYNKEIVPYLGIEIAQRSIYDYIEHDLKMRIGFADKYISVGHLDQEDAEVFGYQKGDPMLVINEKVFLTNGMLFNSSRVIHNYQETTLFVSANNHRRL